MRRRSLLRAAAGVPFASVAGCLDRSGAARNGNDGTDGDGSNDDTDGGGSNDDTDGGGTDHAVDEERIEACAWAVVEADVEAARADPEVARVEEPSPSVVDVERRDDRVIYEVQIAWSVDYRDRTLLVVEPAADPDPPSDAPAADDEAFADAPLLREALAEAAVGDATVRISEFDDGYDASLSALAAAVGRELDGDIDRENPVIVDYEGRAVATYTVREPGLHVDRGGQLTLFAVDGDVYRPVDQPAADAEPADGDRLDC